MNPEDRSVYQNPAWSRVRLIVLARDGYTCQIKAPKCTGDATDCDHIVPWKQGGERFALSNLRAACVACNRGKARAPRGPRNPSREW